MLVLNHQPCMAAFMSDPLTEKRRKNPHDPELIYGLRMVSLILKWCRLSQGWTQTKKNGKLKGVIGVQTFANWLAKETGTKPLGARGLGLYECGGDPHPQENSVRTINREYVNSICQVFEIPYTADELYAIALGIIPPGVKKATTLPTLIDKARGKSTDLPPLTADALDMALRGILINGNEKVLATVLGMTVEEIKTSALAYLYKVAKQRAIEPPTAVKNKAPRHNAKLAHVQRIGIELIDAGHSAMLLPVLRQLTDLANVPSSVEELVSRQIQSELDRHKALDKFQNIEAVASILAGKTKQLITITPLNDLLKNAEMFSPDWQAECVAAGVTEEDLKNSVTLVLEGVADLPIAHLLGLPTATAVVEAAIAELYRQALPIARKQWDQIKSNQIKSNQISHQ